MKKGLSIGIGIVVVGGILFAAYNFFLGGGGTYVPRPLPSAVTTPTPPAAAGQVAVSGPSAPATTAPGVAAIPGGESILGRYYFKGLRILEIRSEGQGVVAELFGQANEDPSAAAAAYSFRDEVNLFIGTALRQPHHGRLTGPSQIEFANLAMAPGGLFDYFVKVAGVKRPPMERQEMTKESRLFNLVGQYFERWTLLSDGRLHVECAIPIFIPGLGAHTEPQIKAFQNLSAFGKYQMVCGWKIRDAREWDAWQALEKNEYAQAAQVFHAVAEAQPKWPFPCFGEVYARIGTREFDLARQAGQSGVARLTDETRPFLSSTMFILGDQVYSYETAALSRDFAKFMETLKDHPPLATTLQEKALEYKPARELAPADLQSISARLNRATFLVQLDQAVWQMRGRGPLLPLGQQAMLAGVTSQEIAGCKARLLVYQTTAKLLKLRGHLERARGPKFYPSAIRQYAQAVRAGQLSRHGVLIGHLIGFQMERIGLGALAEMVEDGLIADPQTFQAFQQHVAFLYQNEPRPMPYEILAYESPYAFQSDALLELVIGLIAVPNSLDAETRRKRATSELSLLQAAALLKSRHLRPPYPASFVSDQLPDDPFAPGQKVRYRSSGTEAVFYSVGPDEKDDQGAVKYDYEKGATSAGDVVLTVR